jgi:arsenite methyltransferase
VELPRHSTDTASRLSALVLGRICPIFSLVMPCQAAASAGLGDTREFHHGLLEGGGCCSSSGCHDDEDAETPSVETSARLGYRDADLASVPHGSNLGLGCGNLHRRADLQEAETVLDLGSGGGLDCFLAARQVGSGGHVIGVDMTAEMVSLARQNLNESDVEYVEFRLGEIEHLPVADVRVDVVMSN